MEETGLLHYGYLLLAAGTIVEGDATLFTAAALAQRGYFRLRTVVLVSMAASLAFNAVVYALARRRGREAFELRAQRHARYARVKRWMERRGGLLVLGSRFIWGLRTAIPAACGASGMGPLRFFLMDVAGAALWSSFVGAAGYGGTHVVNALIADLRNRDQEVLAILTILVGAALMWKRREIEAWWKALRHPEQITPEAVAEFSHEY
ncbi:MAG: DedA family protein, partial [Acidobacteria bacterium]|nr:DedA family protein [Acidobacteriota bacterium]